MRTLTFVSLWAVLFVATACVAGPAAAQEAPPDPSPFDNDPLTTTRVDAEDPVSFGVAVSRFRFPDSGARYAVLSRDDEAADATAAAPLTRWGPLLFTPGEELDPDTEAELERVVDGDRRVYVLGGAGAISLAVEVWLRGGGFDVVRLAGADRIETAATIADEVVRVRGGHAGPVFLARAYAPPGSSSAAWADATVGGPLTTSLPYPLLLTTSDHLHPTTAAALERYGQPFGTLLGGPAALSEEIARQFRGRYERYGGADRATTATQIVERAHEYQTSFLVVNGAAIDGWAFGLAMAHPAWKAFHPILLVDVGMIPQATADLVACRGGGGQVDFVIAGGRGHVSDDLVAALRAIPRQVDVNHNPPEELQEIVHITAERAQQILDRRPLASLEDLTQVEGIGPAELQDIKDQALACVTQSLARSEAH